MNYYIRQFRAGCTITGDLFLFLCQLGCNTSSMEPYPMVKVTHVAKKMLIFVLMALKQLDGASVVTRWLNVGNPPINAV